MKKNKKEIHFYIRKSWDDKSSQVDGAFVKIERAVSMCPQGYNVYDNNGKEITNSTSQAKDNGQVQ